MSITSEYTYMSIKQLTISTQYDIFSHLKIEKMEKVSKWNQPKGLNSHLLMVTLLRTIASWTVNCDFNFGQFRRSPLTSVLIVFIAMFLDGALLTTVVPIIPEKIKDIKITNWVSKSPLKPESPYAVFRISCTVKIKINFRFGLYLQEKM